MNYFLIFLYEILKILKKFNFSILIHEILNPAP